MFSKIDTNFLGRGTAMFRINSKDLKIVVERVMKSARRAKLKNTVIDVIASGTTIILKFGGSELFVSQKIEADITKDLNFSTTVMELNLKVSALPNNELITVEEKDNKIYFKWGRSSLVRVERVDNQCIEMSFEGQGESYEWSYNSIQRITRNMTSFTAINGTAEAKKIPQLAGIYIQYKKEYTELHASDSKKAISMVETDIKWFDEPAAIPTETWFAMYELLSEDSIINISSNGKSLVKFESESTVIISRIIIGTYPDLSSIYVQPEQTATRWTIDRLELLEATRRARHLITTTGSNIELNSDGKKTYLVLKDQLVQQIGAMIVGDIKRFIINPEDLELILSILKTEDIVLCYRSLSSSMTIYGIADEESDKESEDKKGEMNIKCMLSTMVEK